EPTPSFSNDEKTGIAAPGFQSDASDVAAPVNPKVVVSTGMNGGAEFYFPPFRNPSRVPVLVLFTSIWTAIVYFLIHSQAPWIFAPLFGFFDLFLIYALV